MNEYHDDEFQEHLSSPEAMVAFAKQLRIGADWSVRRFHEFLLLVEGLPHLWNGYAPTFDAFMAKCHIGSATVHAQWKIGRGIVGNKQDVIGVHGTRHVLLAPEERRTEFVREMVKTARREKVPLSEQRVRQMAYDFGRQRPPGAADDEPSPAQLKSQLAKAERTIARKDEQIAVLKRENATLKKQLGKRESRGGDDARA